MPPSGAAQRSARGRPCKIGISNGAFTQIISGDLAEGDLVISDAVKVKP